MLKRFAAIFSACALVFALGGCSGQGDSASSDASADASAQESAQSADGQEGNVTEGQAGDENAEEPTAKWPKSKTVKDVPEPDFGKKPTMAMSGGGTVNVEYRDVEREAVTAYVAALKKAGFDEGVTEHEDEMSYTFSASKGDLSKNGKSIMLMYIPSDGNVPSSVTINVN